MTQPVATELTIWGGKALTLDPQNTILDDAVIVVRGGRIAELRSVPGFVPSDASPSSFIDARGCLVMPGLVNCHTHSAMSLLRGIADDLPLDRWLDDVIFPLEAKWGSSEFVEWGARLAFAEMIRSGTTTFADMYYFQEVLAKTAQGVGIRGVVGQAVTEIAQLANGKTDVFELFDQYLAAVEGLPLVTPAMAPHSIYGVTERTWKRMVAYAKQHNLPVLLHLSETIGEDDAAVKQFGMKPTQFFERIGLWEHPKTLVAHAACVTEAEIAILGRYQVGIGHCPESNLKLGTQVAPIVELRAAGCRVGLGTDGAASNNNLDLFQEADTAAKLQILRKGVGQLPAEAVVRMLTVEGAAAVGLAAEIGSLEVGKRADLIAVDLEKPHATPLYQPYSHLVYSASGADVKHSIVEGRVLMKNYHLETIDEAAVLEEARRWGRKIAAR